MRAKKIPVAGLDAVKDLQTGAIVFSQTPGVSAAVRARRAVKEKMKDSEKTNLDLSERLRALEQKLETAMNLIQSRK